MNRIPLKTLTAACVIVLAGCGSSVKLNDTPVESRTIKPTTSSTNAAGSTTSGSTAGSGGATGAAAESRVAAVDLSKKPTMDDGGPVGRIVYFDFDSYVVKDEYRPVVESQAKRLAADKKKQVVVEGHTDERGGSEYNLALGQRRAESVVRALALLGVQETQLEAVSYGKERPAVTGSDEAAWAKNRRAELRDR
jgi:peptidoglycan-associated lipoprotein